jgi:hypothetical protein
MKLNKYSKKIYSQFGEDGIIKHLFKTSKIPIKKYFVDVGAYDGITNSNTYNLWRMGSFKGILIENNEVHVRKIKKLNINEDIKVINCTVEIEGENSIDSILDKVLKKNIEVGYMSIDIQSYDYYLLEKLKVKPQIISIEFNPSIPPYIDYVDPPGQVYLKCSAKAIEKLAQKKGYKLICCSPNNAFLIREDCWNYKHHPDEKVEYLFDYEGLTKYNNGLYGIIHSNPYTTYPISTKPLNPVDKIFFNISRRFLSLLNIRKEKFVYPPEKVRISLKKAGLYY